MEEPQSEPEPEPEQKPEPVTETKKSNSTMMYVVIGLIIVVVGLMYFRGKRNQPTSTMTSEENESQQMQTQENESSESGIMEASEAGKIEQNGNSMMNEEDAVVFEVEGGGFYFKPNEIRVKEGDTVKIILTNAGGTHDWVIDEFSARTKITQTGETDTIEFVADKAGEYEFYCSVGTHRQMGMVGTLIVE